MNVLVTLTTAGADTGPFDLFSDADGYTSAFETNVAKSSLVSGYPTIAPTGTTIIRVKSNGVCTNFVDLALSFATPATLNYNQATSEFGAGQHSISYIDTLDQPQAILVNHNGQDLNSGTINVKAGTTVTVDVMNMSFLPFSTTINVQENSSTLYTDTDFGTNATLTYSFTAVSGSVYDVGTSVNASDPNTTTTTTTVL